MIKHLLAATTAGMVMVGAAFAQSSPTPDASKSTPTATSTPSSANDCIDAAAALGQAAEGKTLTNEMVEKLDALFSKMETLCDSRKFDEAMVIGKDIKTMLDGR